MLTWRGDLGGREGTKRRVICEFCRLKPPAVSRARSALCTAPWPPENRTPLRIHLMVTATKRGHTISNLHPKWGPRNLAPQPDATLAATCDPLSLPLPGKEKPSPPKNTLRCFRNPEGEKKRLRYMYRIPYGKHHFSHNPAHPPFLFEHEQQQQRCAHRVTPAPHRRPRVSFRRLSRTIRESVARFLASSTIPTPTIETQSAFVGPPPFPTSGSPLSLLLPVASPKHTPPLFGSAIRIVDAAKSSPSRRPTRAPRKQQPTHRVVQIPERQQRPNLPFVQRCFRSRQPPRRGPQTRFRPGTGVASSLSPCFPNNTRS